MSVKKKINLLDLPGSVVNGLIKDGALTPVYDRLIINNNTIPKDVIFAHYSKVGASWFVCTSNTVGITGTGIVFTEHSFKNSSPFFIEDFTDGKARAIIISGKSAFVYDEYTKIATVDIGVDINLNCGVMHCGRLFASDGFVLLWSGPKGLDDWSTGLGGSGRHYFDRNRGIILNLLEFGGKVVAVRLNGLTVFNMHGSPENFSVDYTETDCDKIFKNTACIVGDKLYFCSASGIKCFDGKKISPIKTGFNLSNAWSAAALGNKYYLACTDAATGGSMVLCYDTVDGTTFIIKNHAEYLVAHHDVRYFDAGTLSILQKGGTFEIERVLDFGTVMPKTVTKIEVIGSAHIGINNGKHTREFDVENGIVRPKMRGKSFIVTAKGKGAVNSVTVTAEVMDGI